MYIGVTPTSKRQASLEVILQFALISQGFKAKLSIFFFKYEHIIFLVIAIEIFILKTTMYHKYTLTYQKYKKSKKRYLYYRLWLDCAPFCAKHWRHLCPIYMLLIRCDQLKNKSSRRVTYGNPCYSIGSKVNSI
jgi:hypothetical protein